MTAMTRRDETLRIGDSAVRQCRESVTTSGQPTGWSQKSMFGIWVGALIWGQKRRVPKILHRHMGPPLNIDRVAVGPNFRWELLERLWKEYGVGVLLSVSLNRRELGFSDVPTSRRCANEQRCPHFWDENRFVNSRSFRILAVNGARFGKGQECNHVWKIYYGDEHPSGFLRDGSDKHNGALADHGWRSISHAGFCAVLSAPESSGRVVIDSPCNLYFADSVIGSTNSTSLLALSPLNPFRFDNKTTQNAEIRFFCPGDIGKGLGMRRRRGGEPIRSWAGANSLCRRSDILLFEVGYDSRESASIPQRFFFAKPWCRAVQ